MAKTKTLIAGEVSVRPMAHERSWSRSNGTYIAGRAYLDEADQTAAEMEAKWGCDRLRLLVGPELREKFDRQRVLLSEAMWGGQLEDVRRESMRMVKAWLALDRTAMAAGKAPLVPQVWEVPVVDPELTDAPERAAYVVAIVPDDASAHHVIAEGRKVVVYTLEEIGRFLALYPSVAKAKLTFPGATVTAVRRSVDNVMHGLRDGEGLNDEIPDLG